MEEVDLVDVKFFHLATGMRTEICQYLLSYFKMMRQKETRFNEMLNSFTEVTEKLVYNERRAEEKEKENKELKSQCENLFLVKYVRRTCSVNKIRTCKRRSRRSSPS